jgi:acetolactate synthase-1/2/3 large subunit
MNSQELETATRLNLNIIVLVLTDNAFGMIRWKQEDAGLDDFGLTYNNPDFVKYAQCYGASGHRINKADDFIPLIKQCFAQGGVHLIELPIDYSENKNLLSATLQQR